MNAKQPTQSADPSVEREDLLVTDGGAAESTRVLDVDMSVHVFVLTFTRWSCFGSCKFL